MRCFLYCLSNLTIFAFLFFGAGCAHKFSDDIKNNHQTIPDMVRFFEKKNITIEKIALMRLDVVNCDDALAVKIEGSEIGIYKFNIHIKKQCDRLQKITKEGYVYLAGIKKRVLVNGSFILVDSDLNKKRELIEKTFMEFK